MAAVSIPPSPHTNNTDMSTRRVPLTNISNAANSPYRAVAAAAASKRSRSHSSAQRELQYGQHPPPTKKQMLDLDRPSNPQTPPRQQAASHAEGRVANQRRAGATQSTAFERKLVAARERQNATRHTRAQPTPAENLETIRQWQKHYRKVFPQFVFYFESIPEDARVRFAKQIALLGAREEKFFSKEVTHVVTNRPIPTGQDSAPSTDALGPASVATAFQSHAPQPQTINPLLLERSSESLQSQGNGLPQRKFTFEHPLGKKAQQGTTASIEVESKRQQGGGDVLAKAKEMGMKIWALEKLQRMMTTMFETDAGLQPQHGHDTRSNAVNAGQGLPKTTRAANLSQLLREERLNGPSDRDPTVATKEMIYFRGPYIYVRDADEKVRPIMVREYAKVAHREDGDWPQFRSVSHGKCPFVEEVAHSRRDLERERMREKNAQLKRAIQHAAPRTRAAAALEANKMQPPASVRPSSRALTEDSNAGNRGGLPAGEPCKAGDPSVQAVAAKKCSGPEYTFHPARNQHVGAGRAASQFFGGEPIASGLQHSNITSAIRSQMISSTAAAPGAKAGLSKEVHELKRKVLEKNTVPTANGIAPARRVADLANSTTKTDRVTSNFRIAKRRAQEKLGFIDEDFTPSEEEENIRQMDAIKKAQASQPRPCKKRDPKPGYCENCREKFDDFDEHTLSRLHRKFALNNDNWSELDSLLSCLGRPLKE